MTEGSKSSRDALADRPPTAFAPLTPLVAEGTARSEDSVRGLADALAGFERPCRVHLRLVQGDETVETWDVEPGSTSRASDDGGADVVVVLSPETWSAIAAGRVAPYDALLGGRMRVGGDVELAKRVTQHLSDPAVPYVEPC